MTDSDWDQPFTIPAQPFAPPGNRATIPRIQLV